jgi:hypothetical protein
MKLKFNSKTTENAILIDELNQLRRCRQFHPLLQRAVCPRANRRIAAQSYPLGIDYLRAPSRVMTSSIGSS